MYSFPNIKRNSRDSKTEGILALMVRYREKVKVTTRPVGENRLESYSNTIFELSSLQAYEPEGEIPSVALSGYQTWFSN